MIDIRRGQPPFNSITLFELFTDGTCKPNPGLGGWAFILRQKMTGCEIEESGSDVVTTNNRMELQAVIKGIERTPTGSRVIVMTDSQYVQQGITMWMPDWHRRGWKRRTGGPIHEREVANKDLWQHVWELCSERTVVVTWIRGHNGHPENERCDQLASLASAEARKRRHEVQSRRNAVRTAERESRRRKGFGNKGRRFD